MKTITNTNAVINNGAYILDFCNNPQKTGERLTVICYDGKKTLKKYLKAGYYLFGSPVRYSDGYFFALRKNLEPKTKNRKGIVIANAMYFINKAADIGKISFES